MVSETKELSPTVAPSPTMPRMTYDEFLDWADEDTWAEWVHGDVIEIRSVSYSHQNMVSFLMAALVTFVQERDRGMVLSEPFQMKTGPDLPGRSPDILFLAKEHSERLKESYLDGPADLVVEIVSAESGGRDRGDKFYEYERGGVQEY